MCICVGAYACECRSPQRPEASNVSSKNWIAVVCKSSTCTFLLRHLSISAVHEVYRFADWISNQVHCCLSLQVTSGCWALVLKLLRNLRFRWWWCPQSVVSPNGTTLELNKGRCYSLQRMDTSSLATTERWSSLGYTDIFRMLDYQLLANKKFSPTTVFFFYPCPETNSFEF